MMSESKTSAAQTKSQYAPLPDGVYDFRILEAKTGASKSGKPMATIVMAPINPPYEKRRVYHHVLLQDRFRGFSRPFFHALGLGDVDLNEFDFFRLEGMKLRAVLRSENKGGVLRQRLVKFMPFRQSVKLMPVIPEDLPPEDVPLSEVLHFSRGGSLTFRAFSYRGEKDNRKAFDRSRKLISVLDYFLKHFLRDHYGM